MATHLLDKNGKTLFEVMYQPRSMHHQMTTVVSAPSATHAQQIVEAQNGGSANCQIWSVRYAQ